ncbi:MAG: hypothetical protein LIP77_01415, partial [Planctomycetes bacterium]|nr:hypothetical protein [Planctomycetota bacterium]
NVPRVRATCDQVRLHGSGSFLLRLEGALRLECAELDYGLEGLAARRLTRDRPLAEYAEEIIDHVRYLLREAKRYAQSANIGLQRRRLAELLETSLSSPTTTIERPSTRLLL